MAQETAVKQTAEDTQRPEHLRSGIFYRPNVDILAKGDELLVVADVPGASPDGIDLDFEDGLLTIHAKVEPRNQDARFLINEYGVGDFYRTFRVNESIDASRITAECADGVLTLHLPMAESVKPRKIPVKA
jgi:HSP20 family protein